MALILGTYENEPERSNGSGKCLGENTILTHALTGERITIKELYEQNRKDFWVFGMDKDYTLKPTKVIASSYSGHKRLLKIVLENGITEIVSSTHPIFTDKLETRQAQHLSAGDFIAQPRRFDITKRRQTLTAEETRLLAAYMAEGALTSDKISFTNADTDIIAVVTKDLLKAFNLALVQQGRDITFVTNLIYDKMALRKQIIDRLMTINYPLSDIFGRNLGRALSLESGVKLESLRKVGDPEIDRLANIYHAKKVFISFFERCGVYGKKSIHKSLPPFMFSETKENIGHFLGMFISCDGFVADIEHKGAREVSIGLGSEKLIDDLQVLLQMNEIASFKRYKKVGLNGKSFDSWVLTISTFKDNMLRFNDLVGQHLIGPKKGKFDRLIKSYPSNATPYTTHHPPRTQTPPYKPYGPT
jgi:intein/homing endonuclease